MRALRKRDHHNFTEDNSDEEGDVFLEGAPVSDEYTYSDVSIERFLAMKAMEDPERPGQFEDLLLVKWKGQSYLHVSWERQADIERVDLQGKAKIRRFLQTYRSEGDNLIGEDVDYFSPEFIEIDRIISCDTPNCSHAAANSEEELRQIIEAEGSKRQEVRYLVKFKGLTYNEAYWELFEDISYNTEEIFRFWKRQQPPPSSGASSQPSLHEYRKLEGTVYFGSGDEDGLTPRDYQLEGVNWLLWNWWHKRSCILADEMGLGASSA
jgi:SNF2 family DNA or RNA helicase